MSTRTVDTIVADDLPGAADALLRSGYRLALIAGHDDTDRLRAVYLFTAAAPDRRVELHVPLDRARPRVPSLARLSFPASRFERELHDLFGIEPVDHPLPRRLVRHFHWPKGWHPMRADAGEPPEFGEPDGPFPFQPVAGQGVYEIPVGPVHAGMIGPGHFRFSVVGETILKLKPRLWFVHRGIEKLFEGRAPATAVALAERISGDTTVGHAIAFCQAVEEAAGIVAGPDAQRTRAVLLELERLYNHVTDLGALCNDVGYGILNSQAGRVREQLLRLNDSVAGHRLLRGIVHVGGATVATLPDPDRLAAIAADATEIAALAMDNTVVTDRFTGTAVLTCEHAVELGTLGYVARASGVATDARHDHPFIADLPRARHSRTDGDVLSRFLVRVEEIANSVAIIAALVDTPAAAAGERRPSTSGAGLVEGWRGTICHRVELSPDGRLRRVKIVDPSFFNWPALPVALADTIVPDFPLTNKSFNLSYAGNDL